MGWANKCDRCGKYFDWSWDDTDGFTFLSYDPKCGYHVDSEEYDLCPDCVQSLYDWFNGGKHHEK